MIEPPEKPADAIAALRADMPITGRCVYLQTATKGANAQRVLSAVSEAEQLAASEGPAAPAGRDSLLQANEEARAALAGLLNVSAAELCWSMNTSTAMRTVIRAINPTSRDVLITSNLEHGATRSLVTGLRDGCGLTLKTLDATGSADSFLDQLTNVLRSIETGQRPVLLLSQVSCIDGRRLPVAKAVERTRNAAGISIIDGAQAVGQLPVDLRAINADYYIASGHKWLHGPAGVGYIHVHPDQHNAFNPNWLSADELQNASITRRGETGSINWSQRIGLGVAIKAITDIGIEHIEAHHNALADHLRAGLAELPNMQLLGPADPAYTTAIVGFKFTDRDEQAHQAIVQMLYESHNVLIKYQPEQQALRASLSINNDMQEVEQFLAALEKVLQ